MLVLAIAGCAARPRAPLAVAYQPASPARDTTVRRTPLVDATTFWSLPPLDAVALPTGHCELRIGDWYTMLSRVPPVLRLVEDHRGARAEILHVWSERRDREWRLAGSRCSAWVGDARTCGHVIPLPDSVAASAAATFARLGAWEVTERCEPMGVAVADGGELMLERRDGDRFGRYRCNAPSHWRETEAGRRAAALYAYFGSLVRRDRAAHP